MIKKIAWVLAGLLLTGIFSLFYYQLGEAYLQKLMYSFLAFTLVYLVMKVVLEEAALGRMKEAKDKYSFRKVVSILHGLLTFTFIAFLWVEDAQSLLVAYGIIGAGIAIAMQDVFKNFIGGIAIFLNKPFKVGDRIEVNSKFGDVLDIGLLYTSVLEIKEWIKADQPTGRIAKIPNSLMLIVPVNNYTDDHEFIWDEITLPVTYNSDWKEAQKVILGIIMAETRDVIERSNREISRLEEKYYMEKKPTEPAVFITLTDNWVSLGVRYVTQTRRRRAIQSRISQRILDELGKSKKVKIASQTIDIIGFPSARAKK